MTESTAEQQAGLLWRYLKGFHAVHFVAMGMESRLFAAIHEAGDDGINAGDLSDRLGLHRPYIDVWCRTGVHYGILQADDESARYRLAPHMDALLVNTNDPRHLAPYFRTMIEFGSDELRSYPEYFKSGAVHRFQDKGHDFSRHVGDTTAGFHNVVARKLIADIPGMRDRLQAGAKVIDVGCGVGGLICKIAEAWPTTTCVGVDIDPHGVEQAQERVGDAGLADRVAIELQSGGDLGHRDEFDLAVMFEVLHEIEQAHRQEVMNGVARALKPGGALFILDETYPSTIADLGSPEYDFAVQTQFNELIWGNVVPDYEEQQSLFATAGLKEVARQQIGGLFTLMIAEKR